MRSMQLSQNGIAPPPGFAPHTPNMSSIDVMSPSANQNIVIGQSPRSPTATRNMVRDQSKTGSAMGTMGHPQSPATMQRAPTPKPNQGKTPKQKEDALPAMTPKSNAGATSQPSSQPAVADAPTDGPFSAQPQTSPHDPPSSASAPGAINPPHVTAEEEIINTADLSDPNFNLGGAGDFDFESLVNMGNEGTFDFGLYLAEIGDDQADGGDAPA